MKNKLLAISIFILSIICLIVAAKMMWNVGVFVDQFNTSPNIVFGGYWDWINMGILLLISILSGINILVRNK